VRILSANLEGPLVLEPEVHGDERGFFLETYRASVLEGSGLELEWVQDNHSRSRRGVVRGMHFQPSQAKLVRCARGAILDVIVDIRPSSETFGRWEAFELDDRSHRQLYCPDGFAHGFCVLSEEADVVYKTSVYWDPACEQGFAFDDPDVGICWPAGLELRASARDREALPLRTVMRLAG
jgi:dTDP-4-dehydrorhamnose 3,5-epimerase